MNKLITYSIASSILIAGLGIFYNFGIVQPSIERERLEQEQAARQAVEAEKKLAAAAAEAKENARKNDYKNCVATIDKIMLLSRESQCMKVAKYQDDDRKNCIGRGGDPHLCGMKYPPLDSSPGCPLAPSIVMSNKNFEREGKQKCLEEAKAGL